MTFDANPQMQQILSNVQIELCKASPEEHAILRHEAESLLGQEYSDLQSFFTQHDDIRARMIVKGYPLITHESTYVDIIRIT